MDLGQVRVPSDEKSHRNCGFVWAGVCPRNSYILSPFLYGQYSGSQLRAREGSYGCEVWDPDKTKFVWGIGRCHIFLGGLDASSRGGDFRASGRGPYKFAGLRFLYICFCFFLYELRSGAEHPWKTVVYGELACGFIQIRFSLKYKSVLYGSQGRAGHIAKDCRAEETLGTNRKEFQGKGACGACLGQRAKRSRGSMLGVCGGRERSSRCRDATGSSVISPGHSSAVPYKPRQLPVRSSPLALARGAQCVVSCVCVPRPTLRGQRRGAWKPCRREVC